MSSFEVLSNPIQVKIFNSIPSLVELIKCVRVCRHWKGLIEQHCFPFVKEFSKERIFPENWPRQRCQLTTQQVRFLFARFASSIKNVSLSGVVAKMDSEIVEMLKSALPLETLDLDCVSTKRINHNMTNPNELDYDPFPYTKPGELLEALTQCEALQSVTLYGIIRRLTYTDEELDLLLQFLQRCTSLRRFRLIDCAEFRWPEEPILFEYFTSSLQHLEISYSIVFDGSILATIGNKFKLKTLKIAVRRSVDMRQLRNTCQRLETLFLYIRDFREELQIFNADCLLIAPELKSVYVREEKGNKFSKLAFEGTFEKLESVGLHLPDDLNLSDIWFPSLEHYPNLTNLYLCNSMISSESLLDIARKGRIKELTLANCPNICAEKLFEAILECKALRKLQLSDMMRKIQENELLECICAKMDSLYDITTRPSSKDDPRIFILAIQHKRFFFPSSPCSEGCNCLKSMNRNLHPWLFRQKFRFPSSHSRVSCSQAFW
ncbi:hypothetical protein DdX_19228 [Ditylenchus destructor]|uniref:F-box domain-containing protein n=1 Tax=Ditylenchus destructor TaxID=166010 RepID=A0AAD4MIV5_9BILA|nr:hypothetical protein DdX_19228 [Ditylenchus destructor]